MMNGYAIGSLLISYQELVVVLRRFVSSVTAAGNPEKKHDYATAPFSVLHHSWIFSLLLNRR
jgi:hypothetical protein